MREMTFAIKYKQGVDPIMDVFIDSPELQSQSLDGFVTEDRFWRIERILGPENACRRIEDIRFDDEQSGETITECRCSATRYHDVLQRSSNGIVLYSYLEDIRSCESVHTLVGKHLPSGMVVQSRRNGNIHDWRILMRSDANVGVLYDEICARLRDGLSFQMGRVRDADHWQQESVEDLQLPTEQRAALEMAIEAGYYATPRRATLDSLCEQLEIPRSTLSYRLRRAEAQLVEKFKEGRDSPKWLT